ncbi:hypothetical protein ACKI1P_34670 [Streptomyces turgidiscabies]|uniref:hypothetical protein n=1 Tax=Streptomyces turgidiscabies TaxID=85558 RepID=UPI0038F6984B
MTATVGEDLKTGRQLHTLHGHKGLHTAEALEIDGHAPALTTDRQRPGNELIWDLETGACLNPRKNASPAPSPTHST